MAKAAAIRRRDGSDAESCGYVTFILSIPLSVIYFLWAFLPDDVILGFNVDHYPPRVLAGHIPAYLMMLFVCLPFLYMGLNMMSSPALDDIDTLWDTRARSQVGGGFGIERASNHAEKDGSGVENGCGGASAMHGIRNHLFREDGYCSVPNISDLDVHAINLHIRKKLQKKQKNS